MMEFILSNFLHLIEPVAKRYDLPCELIIAIISKESSGVKETIRYEQNYRYFNDTEGFASKNGISTETETCAQRMSWGLMQIMGSTARDMGFTDLLPKMIYPNFNIEIGCKYLHKMIKRYDGDKKKAISAYNAGVARIKGGIFANNQYVSDVLNLEIEAKKEIDLYKKYQLENKENYQALTAVSDG